MGAGRDVWVKIRATSAERDEWHAKAGAAGLTLSDLVRRAIGRVHAWTVAHAEVERERTRELARIGANLNQIARWANTFKANAEALEVVAHLVAIERVLDTLAVESRGGPRAMMVKFLAHGTGSAAAVAAYLLREGHHAKDPDPDQAPEEITVLRGNLGQVTAVADALAFEHRYTSGLFAWAPEDAPSDKQIGRVLDEFEKTAWAGLEPDRYAWAAVQHRNADRGVHVHILVARCELATGKSLNIAPPGWEKTFGALRDWQNHRERLEPSGRSGEGAGPAARPYRAYIDAAQLRAGLATEPDPRRLTHRLRAPGHRSRGHRGSGHNGSRPTTGGPRGPSPGQELSHSGGPRQRRPVAAERSDL